MGQTNTEHETLVAGIRIESKENVGGTFSNYGAGTLTGLATRIWDRTQVAGHQPPRHEQRHHLKPQRQRGDVPGRPLDLPSRKVGTNVDYVSYKDQNNDVDLATCDLIQGVKAEHTLHDDPHSNRKVVAGTVEPTEGLTLLMLGAVSGEREVTVKTVSYTGRLEPSDPNSEHYRNVIILNVGDTPPEQGDSGAPCLRHVGDNKYKMCCILFAGESLRSEDSTNDAPYTATAFLASTAETLMGIRFGNRAPIATAGYAQLVGLGDSVTLDGSGSTDPEGDTLSYQWEQVPDVLHTVILSSATANKPTFTAPTAPTTLSFRLTVTDSLGTSATDTVSVTVLAGAESLGGLAYGQTYTRTGSWSASVASVNRPGRYAKFYNFSLSQRAKVRIDLGETLNNAVIVAY